jgi:hypothetical protein
MKMEIEATSCHHREKRESTRIRQLPCRGKTVRPGQTMGSEIYKVAKNHEMAK